MINEIYNLPQLQDYLFIARFLVQIKYVAISDIYIHILKNINLILLFEYLHNTTLIQMMSPSSLHSRSF